MKNCISRRSFLKAAGMLGAAGALAACGGSSSSTAPASSAASSAASAAATGANIKLWTYPIGGWGNDDTVQNLISSFNAKYPDIKVTVENLYRLQHDVLHNKVDAILWDIVKEQKVIH
mgnify:CR=1 FL=1